MKKKTLKFLEQLHGYVTVDLYAAPGPVLCVWFVCPVCHYPNRALGPWGLPGDDQVPAIAGCDNCAISFKAKIKKFHKNVPVPRALR